MHEEKKTIANLLLSPFVWAPQPVYDAADNLH